MQREWNSLFWKRRVQLWSMCLPAEIFFKVKLYIQWEISDIIGPNPLLIIYSYIIRKYLKVLRRILIPYLNLKHQSKSYPLKGTYVKRAVFLKKLFFFFLNFGWIFVVVWTTIAKMMKNISQPFNVHFLLLLGCLVTRPFMEYAIWQGIGFYLILLIILKSIVLELKLIL